MKRNLLKIIFAFNLICIASFTNAQIAVETDTLTTPVVESFDIVGHNTFTNLISETKTFVWTRNIISTTEGWTFAVCDQLQCYLPTVETMAIELAPEATSLLDVHLYPNGTYEGDALVEMKVEHQDDPDTNIFAYYIYSSDVMSSSEDIASLNLNIYPNPSQGLFHIEDSEEKVKFIEVYNSIGQKLMQVSMDNGEFINLSHLDSGSYMLQLLGDSRQYLDTKRVFKN